MRQELDELEKMAQDNNPYLKYAEDLINKNMDCIIPDDVVYDLLVEISTHCENDLEIVEYCKKKINHYKSILIINKGAINKNMYNGRKGGLNAAAIVYLDEQMKSLITIEKEAASYAAYWTILMNQKDGNNK